MTGRLLPLIAFVLLAILLAVGLTISDHKTDIPSPLIGKQIPEFSLPVLGDPGRVINRDDLLGKFEGRPFVINVWASWCPPCRLEHPLLMELARDGRIPIVGLHYRDQPDAGQTFLTRFGDPAQFHLSDVSGRTSIDFGVYAAPETFLIDGDGKVAFKHIGALTNEVVAEHLLALNREQAPR